MADFTSIADMMQACAAEAVLAGHDQFGFTLDYSEASVQSLETILANIHLSEDKESMEQAVKTWGSYLGEVVRRSFGGDWELVQPPGKAAAVPTLVIGGSQLYPLMKVYRRLTMGEPENVWKFYEKIRARLSPVHPTDSFAN
jgi:hypothetical protein